MTTALRKALHFASPRYRRWRRFLDDLTLDPGTLPRPVEQPTDRDFIICGVPRSGTSLLDAVLHRPPDVVTVMEPWDGMRLPPAALFRSLRREIVDSGELRRGKLDAVSVERGEVAWMREGVPTRLETRGGFLLGVKWPAFWRYLDLLPDTKFVVCLRHPCEVISSFARIGGRLSEGLDYDVAFNRAMNDELQGTTSDLPLRRVLLHDYIASRILPHLSRPNVLPLPYERWFTDPEGQLRDLGDFLGLDLREAGVRIRASETEVDPRIESLVRDHCTTAEALGYGL